MSAFSLISHTSPHCWVAGSQRETETAALSTLRTAAPPTAIKASIRGAFGGSEIHPTENVRGQDFDSMVDILWQKFFEDPSLWWDKRNNKKHGKNPDFVQATTCETLYINRLCPQWVLRKLSLLRDSSSSRVGRAQYREDGRVRHQGGIATSSAGSAGRAGHDRSTQPKFLPNSGGAKLEEVRESLKIYEDMIESGAIPRLNTVIGALRACSRLRLLETGKKIHGHAMESGLGNNMFLASSLVDMYSKCGSTVDARFVFDGMVHRDVVSWNAMILGYTYSEEGELALELYARMICEGFLPDSRTFVGALKACASLALQEEGKKISGKLLKVACLRKGRAIHARARESGLESDIFVANTLVDMYAKCGSMEDAYTIFDSMTRRDVMTWTSMILGCVQRSEGHEALQLYARMQREGIVPDARTFAAALKACANLGAHEGKDGNLVRVLETGRAIHSEAGKSGLASDIFVANTLVDMYAKCGSMVEARQVFDSIPRRNVVLWNTMILGYAQGEQGELALELYERMQYEGFTPSSRTFVGALKACGNLAEREESKDLNGTLLKIRCLEKGRAIHSQVAENGLLSDIYIASALVDMYAKCGSEVDACEVFNTMSHHDEESWAAMILGCANRNESELALQLLARMQDKVLHPILKHLLVH